MTQFSKNLFVLISILSIFFITCKNSSNNEVNNNRKEDVSPLKDTVYVINKTDTVFIEKDLKEKNIEKKDTSIIKNQIATKTMLDKILTKKKLENTSDEITYYKGTMNTSTIITPWKNGIRHIKIFDKNGNITYEIKDENSSYSSTTRLRYHADSSLIDATTNLNPGASMNWYLTTTKFKEDNQPTYQETIEYPQKLSAVVEGSRLKTWDTINKKWISSNK